MINKKVVFCIPVRNESSNLKSLFKTLDKLNLKFEDYFIIFVESDSSDNSSDLIKKYLERRKGVLINKNLQGIENRVMRLAISRNEYLNFIKNDQSLKTYDLMIVLDCGGVNGSLTAKKIKNAILENENSIGIGHRFFMNCHSLRSKWEPSGYKHQSKICNYKKKTAKILPKSRPGGFSTRLWRFFWLWWARLAFRLGV